MPERRETVVEGGERRAAPRRWPRAVVGRRQGAGALMAERRLPGLAAATGVAVGTVWRVGAVGAGARAGA